MLSVLIRTEHDRVHVVFDIGYSVGKVPLEGRPGGGHCAADKAICGREDKAGWQGR